jgi:broad specificity phosphatase PhoE
MLASIPFYFLRHGETDWNRQHLCQGQTDVPLNARGLAQSHAARIALAKCPVGTICSSPLSRALDTARIVNQDLNKPLVILDDLKECDFGAYEGRLPLPWYWDWKRGILPAGAESYEEFIERALRGINAALSHDGPVLIVAHGGIYWAVEIHGRLRSRFRIPNGVALRHDPPVDEGGHWQVFRVTP